MIKRIGERIWFGIIVIIAMIAMAFSLLIAKLR